MEMTAQHQLQIQDKEQIKNTCQNDVNWRERTNNWPDKTTHNQSTAMFIFDCPKRKVKQKQNQKNSKIILSLLTFD